MKARPARAVMPTSPVSEMPKLPSILWREERCWRPCWTECCWAGLMSAAFAWVAKIASNNSGSDFIDFQNHGAWMAGWHGQVLLPVSASQDHGQASTLAHATH